MTNLIKGTYSKEDCTFLLQNMAGKISPVTQEEKKGLMLSGKKSYEMIPFEYKIDPLAEGIFLRLTTETKGKIARCVGVLAEGIYSDKGKNVVLVSLARGGIPVGVLCKRYLKKFHQIDVPHYVISLIRNEGIDVAALNYIIDTHPNGVIQFIDGWTGMGYISSQLEKYVSLYNADFNQKVDCSLGVLVDSSKICRLFGTRDDVIFPGCCMNATVCGMISSIYYDRNIIAHDDFHGAMQWEDTIGTDYSCYLVDVISECFTKEKSCTMPVQENYASKCLNLVSKEFGIKNSKNIKFGIGESTRAIIRYNLKCLLIKDLQNPDLQFLIELAHSKKIKIIRYDKTDYECIALISEKEVF